MTGHDRLSTPPVLPAVDLHIGSGGRADRILLEGPHSRTRELRLVLFSIRDFIARFRKSEMLSSTTMLKLARM